MILSLHESLDKSQISYFLLCNYIDLFIPVAIPESDKLFSVQSCPESPAGWWQRPYYLTWLLVTINKCRNQFLMHCIWTSHSLRQLFKHRPANIPSRTPLTARPKQTVAVCRSCHLDRENSLEREIRPISTCSSDALKIYCKRNCEMHNFLRGSSQRKWSKLSNFCFLPKKCLQAWGHYVPNF